jgi:hypothetical protein
MVNKSALVSNGIERGLQIDGAQSGRLGVYARLITNGTS